MTGPSPDGAPFSRWATFAPAIRRWDGRASEMSELLDSEFGLYRDDAIGIFYAPFDHIAVDARLAIVGVTPGPTQVFESIRVARDALTAGLSDDDAQAQVKERASFKGMRRDLGTWLDAIGLAQTLGIAACEPLFERGGPLPLHTTSMVRYPTLERTRDGTWSNWNGHRIRALEHRVLRAMVDRVLGEELQLTSEAVIVPLGQANAAIEHLCALGKLDRSRCVIGLPHPSPASARRHELFERVQQDLASQVAALNGGVRPARASRPATNAPAPRRRPHTGNEARITLTDGNIRNGHFYLRRHLHLFPDDAIGPPNLRDGEGVLVTVRFAGLPEPVLTDIAGGNKLFFRRRRPIEAFFELHALRGGDELVVRRVGERAYVVEPVRR